MKKFIALFTMIVLLPACYISKESAVNYNNAIVEQMKLVTPAIEESATLYNSTIPNPVTELTEIDTSAMQSSYDTAYDLFADLKPLSSLESREEDQQAQVRADLETYITAAELYFESYSKVLGYYSTGDYKQDVTKVTQYDEDLHNSYTTFIEANNDLVETLDSFMNTDEQTVTEQ